MKGKIFIVLSLLLAVGTADVSAQSFLKKLEKNVKKEVENRVQQEVRKKVNKGIDKGVEAVTGEQPKKSLLGNSSSYTDNRVSFTTIAPMEEYGPAEGKLNGHEWVDLGLPSGVRWATCNIDATAPGQPGKLYAWGETVTKTNFVDANSKTNNKKMEDISGDPVYDVATAKWGKDWRIPTEKEFYELLCYCDYDYEPNGNIYWQKFTSRINKKILYLPATGFKESSDKLTYPKTNGSYWTSTPVINQYNNGAGIYHFAVDEGRMSHGGRSMGNAVRPVTYYDVKMDIPYDGETNGHKWVDLGLPSGTKWALYNLGANAVDRYGDYYGWGGTTRFYVQGYEKGTYAKEDVVKDISGDARYDAATAHWGGAWCMPSADDFVELMEHCTWEMTQIGPRKGMKVTSKHNGKFIFLPVSGQIDYSCDYYRNPEEVNKVLIYWTSSTQTKSEAQILKMLTDAVTISSSSRSYCGYPIRPVIK